MDLTLVSIPFPPFLLFYEEKKFKLPQFHKNPEELIKKFQEMFLLSTRGQSLPQCSFGPFGSILNILSILRPFWTIAVGHLRWSETIWDLLGIFWIICDPLESHFILQKYSFSIIQNTIYIIKYSLSTVLYPLFFIHYLFSIIHYPLSNIDYLLTMVN